MTGSTRKSPGEEQRKEKTEMRVNRIAIVTATALLGILGAVILCAQDQDKEKYSLISPDGVAFSDFRGYEDWSVVSSARSGRSSEGNRRQSGNDQGVQKWIARKWALLSGGVEDRETAVEAQEEHGSAFRGGCSRCF